MLKIVQTDSDRTSIPPCVLPPFLSSNEPISGEVQVGQVIAAPPEAEANFIEPDSGLSGRRKPFNANLIISAPCQISVISAYREANTFFVFDVNFPTSGHPVVQTHPNTNIQRSSHLSKTKETWAVWNTLDVEAGKCLAELRSVVCAIRLGIAPQRSQEFEDLLGRALAAHGMPKDVDEWARALAQDVSDLDD